MENQRKAFENAFEGLPGTQLFRGSLGTMATEKRVALIKARVKKAVPPTVSVARIQTDIVAFATTH